MNSQDRRMIALVARLRALRQNWSRGWLLFEDTVDYRDIVRELGGLGIEIDGFTIEPSHFARELTSYDSVRKRKHYSAPRISRDFFFSKLDGLITYLDSVGYGQAEPENSKLDQIEGLLVGFNRFAKQLRKRSRGQDPFTISDEYDVQYLLHSLLKLYFDDIRPEEPTHSYAAKSARMDFFVPDCEAVVEAKYVRSREHAKTVGEEIQHDVNQYATRSDCKHLFVLVHDPNDHIGNPSGFIRDLEKLKINDLPIKVIISD